MALRGLGGAASTNPHNKNKVKYVLIPIAIAAIALLVLFGIYGLPSNENIQYVGSSDGYQGFVPKGVINYEGRTNPKGDLILDNGTTLHNTIWHGKYSDTIIENHNYIVKLNNDFVGKINPVNKQPYVPLQDVYVIKGQVPIKEITIDGQIHYLIDANKINEANVAGFHTYREWVDDFVAALNTPETTAARLPGNSPVFRWQNLTGTVAYQTMEYGGYGPFAGGGYVLVLPSKTIIPYGIIRNIIGPSFNNYIFVGQLYNPPN
jgi:hypothetical protein